MQTGETALAGQRIGVARESFAGEKRVCHGAGRSRETHQARFSRCCRVGAGDYANFSTIPAALRELEVVKRCCRKSGRQTSCFVYDRQRCRKWAILREVAPPDRICLACAESSVDGEVGSPQSDRAGD